MNPSLLNKKGWRVLPQPIQGTMRGLDLSGQLIARNDAQGIGVLRLSGGDEIKVHTDWFVKAKSEPDSTTARPTRKARPSRMEALLAQLANEGLVILPQS